MRKSLLDNDQLGSGADAAGVDLSPLNADSADDSKQDDDQAAEPTVTFDRSRVHVPGPASAPRVCCLQLVALRTLRLPA